MNAPSDPRAPGSERPVEGFQGNPECGIQVYAHRQDLWAVYEVMDIIYCRYWVRDWSVNSIVFTLSIPEDRWVTSAGCAFRDGKGRRPAASVSRLKIEQIRAQCWYSRVSHLQYLSQSPLERCITTSSRQGGYRKLQRMLSVRTDIYSNGVKCYTNPYVFQCKLRTYLSCLTTRFVSSTTRRSAKTALSILKPISQETVIAY
jgi:hypothetical protein